MGKMLALAAAKMDLKLWILDRNDCPAKSLAFGFSEGDFRKYEDVYRFGKEMDIITIEIEDVNTDALKDLQREGKLIHPDPASIELIKDKGRQKLYYKEKGIPTAGFALYETMESIIMDTSDKKLRLPFVQKVRTTGYDGRGVCVIKSDEDLTGLFPGQSVVEEVIDIKKEIAIIAGRNRTGEIAIYPPVEMEFHSKANLVERLICPADIHDKLHTQMRDLSKKLIRELNIRGLLAVEFFQTADDKIVVNEIAPRPHNSGHHTIEGCFPSQYEMHLRAIMDLPLYDPVLLSPTVMVNLLGSPGFKGKAIYKGVEECLAIPGVSVHIYGKDETRPWRKMGHVTIVDNHLERALKKANFVCQSIKIIS